MNRSSFLRRYFAFFIDSIILSLVFALLSEISQFLSFLKTIITWKTYAFSSISSSLFSKITADIIIQTLTALVIYWLYFALFESSKYQATPGKLILNIKVANKEGGKLNFTQAVIRSFVKAFSAVVLNILFIVCLFTKSKQNLHDYAGKTYVIYKEQTENAGNSDDILRPVVIVFMLLWLAYMMLGAAAFKKLGFSLEDAASLYSVVQSKGENDSLLDWQTIQLPDIDISLESPVGLTKDSQEEDTLLSYDIGDNVSEAICYKSERSLLFDLKIQYITFFTEVSANDVINWELYKKHLFSRAEISETEISGFKALHAEIKYANQRVFVILKNKNSAWIITTKIWEENTAPVIEKVINSLKLGNTGENG